MAFSSVKSLVATVAEATPVQFDAWNKAWRAAVESGSTESLLGSIAREKGVSEDTFLQKLATALGWSYLDIPKLTVPPEARNKISTKIAFQYSILPTALTEGVLQVATSDPFDAAMMNAVRFNARMPVQFVLATKVEIEKALKKYYGVGAETLDEMGESDAMDIDLTIDKEITEGDQEASVIKFVNQIIWEAFKDRATDIHFEPAEDELRIRNRIDGILHQIPLPPQLKRFQAALISRIKVMSGMNISEKRLPQDGRINVRIKGEEIDIRVSTVPTVYGESVSLRLLTRGKIFLSLDKLGFSKKEEDAIREIIIKPHGIFLVTGPTGSGKSTSLYAFLSSINSVTKRIITIEEPVEYELKGINQIAVRSDIGLTFAMGLRHILRQDPNVIMVGEIRDLETAEIAIRASLTGHLVFSTLHTNDAPSAFTRLIDMGIEPFLVASSVEAVMAQRLIRTICPHCKTELKVSPEYLARIGFPEADIATAKVWHGVGCELCRQLGYQGRKGIYELLLVTEAVRPLILSRAPATTIAQRAMDAGMRTLRTDGWNKVKAGETTIEEILRVTQIEEFIDKLGESEKIKLMARWNSCNILDALTGTHRLWHFDAKGSGFVLDREHPAKPGESLPARLTAKSWSSLWLKKLNVAWFPPENVFLKLVELPEASFEETLSMVELQLEKLSPIPVTQIAWTLHILPRRAATRADGAADALQTVVVVIVERNLVEEFLGQLESRGYLADRLEMPVLDQLEAADAKSDGVWIYPSIIAGQNAAVVAWWLGGVLRDLSLVTLPPAGSAGESLKSQFARLAWAGELEGWLTTHPAWHLVADTVNAGIWAGALREQLGESVALVAPLTQAELASRTAHRAARAQARANLLPAEFSARYQVQFVDRLWVRGLMAVGLLYMAVVGVYLGFIYCPLFGLDSKTTSLEQRVASMGASYTNALQLTARYDVLKERQDLKFASLDCWQLIADQLPAGISLQRMSFSDGKKLAVSGTVAQEDLTKVIDFMDTLRKSKVKDEPMFDPTGGEPFSEHAVAGGTQVSWSFGLLLKNAEATPK